MNGSREVGLRPTGSPLEAFTGTIKPTKIGPLYSAGLAVTAFAMVLLPLIYLSLIAFASWLVYWHLRNDTWIFQGASGRGGFWRLLLYLGPAAAGGILVFFMVKPFFAARAKKMEPITVDPAAEPLLFAFVRRICTLVGAPVPARIDVDCQVNASASLRRGFWSRNLVLTIGLPMAMGLDMRQFAGVLAHEFGHFAQGVGMRMTYLIRSINFWFARVVYERDEWDLKLDQSARNSDWRLAIVLQTARGCVWVTRRILWALMQVGNVISCFMLRQMEYDADSYEAKIAGSDAFGQTAARMRLLNEATRSAYDDAKQSWASLRLPESMPLLIGHKVGMLPPEVHEKLSSQAASEKTGWFDTHPCDADRNRAVNRLNQPGVFRLTEPATGLFSDFAELSKTVTRHQYERQFELKFTEQNLIPAEEILRESTAVAEAEAMIRKYFGEVAISLKPLLVGWDLPPVAPDENAVGKWRKACQAVQALRASAEQRSAECIEEYKKLAGFTAARCLATAEFKVEPAEFGLPGHATTPGDQEIAARFALDVTGKTITKCLAKVEPYVEALRQRVILALRIVRSNNGVPQGDRPEELPQLLRLLVAVGAEMSNVHAMGSKLKAFMLLAQNRGNHSDPAQVDRIVSDLSSELNALVRGIQQRLGSFPYPFPHARGQLTVAEYARAEELAGDKWIRSYQDAAAHVDRLLALNSRLVGRVLRWAETSEEQIEALDP